MGAQFDSVRFAASNETVLKENFANHIEQLRYDQGNESYSGHMGMAQGLRILDKTFKNSDDAFSWLEENTQKWGPALAVKCGDFSKLFPQTAGDKKLNDSFLLMEKELKNWDTDILKRVKSAKSLQRTCSKCASKVSVSFLKTNSCPVCNSDKFLQTETDDKKLIALKTKFKDVSEKLTIARKKFNEKASPAYWAVGALCSS